MDDLVVEIPYSYVGDDYVFMVQRKPQEEEHPLLTNLSIQSLDDLESFSGMLPRGASFDPDHIDTGPNSIMAEFFFKNRDRWLSCFSRTRVPVIPVMKVVFPTGKVLRLFFFYVPNNVDLRTWFRTWRTVIGTSRSFIFYGHNRYTLFTEQNETMRYLSQAKSERMEEIRQSDKYNFVKKMHHWYKEEADAILAEAKATLDEFAYETKFTGKIYEYLVVPYRHYRRYYKAQSLIKNKYEPDFVMSLPMFHKSVCYTILFPVVITTPW